MLWEGGALAWQKICQQSTLMTSRYSLPVHCPNVCQTSILHHVSQVDVHPKATHMPAEQK